MAVHAGALGAGQHVGFAEVALLPAVLLEPVQAELGVGVEIVLGQEAVDELEGRAHAHGRAVGLQHGGVFGEDRHARADDGLRKIHRRHGRTLVAGTLGHLVERLGQHAVQLADELAAGNGGGIGWALAADEDDAGSEGVGTGADHAVGQFGSHGPGAGEVPIPRDARLREKVSQPVEDVPMSVSVSDCLKA